MKTKTDKFLTLALLIVSGFLVLVTVVYFFNTNRALDRSWSHTYFPGSIFFSALLVFIVALNHFKKKVDFNKSHPEIKEDEVFISNATSKDFFSIGWQTKRLGGKAYDPFGRVLEPDFHPVFIKKKEIVKAIKDSEDKLTKKIWQRLL